MRRRWVLWLVGAAVLLAALGVAAVAWLRGLLGQASQALAELA